MGGRREEEEVGRCELDRVGIDFLRPEKKTTRQRACRYGTVSRFGRPLDLFHARPRLRHYSEVMAAAPPPSLVHHPRIRILVLSPQVRCIPRREVQNRFRRVADVAARAPSSSNHYPTWKLFGVVCVVCQVGFYPPPPPSAAVSQGSPHWHVRYENAVLSGRAAEGQFRKDNVADAR